MAEIITMPRLSDTMTEGVVAQWLKKVGDKIEEGDILAQIETDKATMEFESFNEGYLLHIGLQEGETAPVDSLLAIIGEQGEDISALLAGGATKTTAKEETPAPVAAEKTDAAPAKTETAPAAEAFVVPDNITVVTMPRLSDTMTDGTVASWLKKVGDKVSEGDILAEIETDKATMEFESFNEGTLLYVGLQEGENAPVDSLLAIIGEAGTDVTAVVAGFGSVAAAPVAAAPKEQAPTEFVVEKKNPTTTTNNANTTATKKVSAINSENGRIVASPLARVLAEEKGINLAKVVGTGEGGRIVKTDIENYNPVVETAVAAATVVAAPAGEISRTEVKNSQMRKAIVKALDNSQTTAVNFTVTMEIDMDNAIASRETINALPDTKISFNDLVVKACAMALKSHPQINTEWTNEQTIYNNHISIGVAVAIEDGLVVPVIPFTDSKSLTQIGAEIKDLAIKAKNKKLTPAEMSGSTFTVSNLGMFGVDHFTSIINQPNSAILSVGGIKQKPVVKKGEIVVGNVMTLTLACDHRTIDGAVGAAFMNTLKQYIENPVAMLA
ncbi:pyruvate dehydrogenase [Lutibacter sp. HS1-25]|uniref:pyruvate dehydrogenase complex dihydrolipoamide acetyltransferase n=1 Tax=Lutibacter sp. HS1-25 TaxID=2485000 RepID=UPI001011D675|nr:pyruvate dehydrogenase complex dihydrolipoamide acetyltransferase [Lutibacter sp. HS1-25]RXP63330.1 pyruvate dehydrogenase [Lutibacter sp. HS1-25]